VELTGRTLAYAMTVAPPIPARPTARVLDAGRVPPPGHADERLAWIGPRGSLPATAASAALGVVEAA
jgi:hypothetical protein